MKVLGISGSPRADGNTEILLDKLLEGAGNKGIDVVKIVLNCLKFSPCQECENMRDDGVCIVKDDMQSFYKEVEEADVIILASPIFFGSLSAQTKMMIDRFQCLWRAKYMFKKEFFNKRKSGIFVCVEASNRQDFFENAKAIVKNFFATINADYKDEIFCSEAAEKGSILKRSEVLEKAFKLGRKIVV